MAGPEHRYFKLRGDEGGVSKADHDFVLCVSLKATQTCPKYVTHGHTADGFPMPII